jgi:acylphosphatase
MQRKAVRLVIKGRVQGVGYRWWAVQTARRLGLDGWVRNRRDGTVELVAVGPDEALEALIWACRQGPSAAQVASVDRFDAADDGCKGFEDRPTA